MTPAERLLAAMEAATARIYGRLRRLEERQAFREQHTIPLGQEPRYERLQAMPRRERSDGD